MENRIDAIYGRQSVDRKDSISIESQIEFCKYELRGGSFKEYTDKGYSGKNTDRPKFQELLADIKRGLIKRVVVYKLDRISRSILDFATMMETFQAYNVEFVSSTEKFDTSTPMGRAMLNICIVFAQLERETIQKLLNTLTGANAVLLSYANGKIEELDTHRQTLIKAIAEMSAETMSPDQIELMSAHLDNWQSIDFEDRRQVADGLISQIRATCDHVSIEWKI